jgi:hypothetical protein
LSFKSSVISGVLSTLIAAFIIWLSGFWSTAWNALAELISTTWMLLVYPIEIPIGILAPLALYLTYRIFHLYYCQVGSDELAVEEPHFQSTSLNANLSENEIALLRLLAAVDGRWIGIEHISSQLMKSKLVTEQTLERALNNGLIFESKNYIHGSTFRLSPQGRDYAIDQGFAK